jgi:hypothetical protein
MKQSLCSHFVRFVIDFLAIGRVRLSFSFSHGLSHNLSLEVATDSNVFTVRSRAADPDSKATVFGDSESLLPVCIYDFFSK